ncbi:MAG: GNAT family N-acetyltransferase, partial [Candidatus Micrarchaeota archaeon]|nr:GNAT family N-acetyltransferase [Candidatus Micrarchaeota archaeon]
MPGKNFVIGDASAKDSSAITGMYYRLYPNRARRGVRRRVTEVKSRNRIFVARSGKAPVGFLVATFTSYGGSRYGYIEELFVDEAHRRSGIGRGLV